MASLLASLIPNSAVVWILRIRFAIGLALLLFLAGFTVWVLWRGDQ